MSDHEDRYSLYRLCECPECEGTGKEAKPEWGVPRSHWPKCPECRGEGRVRQEVVSTDTAEGVGVALVTCAREKEWEECPFGLLDRRPECPECEGSGHQFTDWPGPIRHHRTCPTCKGSGVKPTGTWLISPWLPSTRNVRDAAKLLRAQR